MPDISGVCSIAGTFEMTSKPMNAASTKTVSSTISGLVHADAPLVGDAGGADDLVGEVERAGAPSTTGAAAASRRCGRTAGSRAAACRSRAGSGATIVTPSTVVGLARVVGLAVAARVSAARSTTTEPCRIAATIARVTRIGAGRPGMSAVVITTSDVGDVPRDELLLEAVGLLGELLRVAAGALAVALGQLDRDERRAEALDLLARGRRARRTPTRPRRAGARSRSPAGRRRRRRAPAPCAGGTVPAAVISSGKKRGSSAASSAAR